MKCHKNNFKDKCDECGKFDYLKGIDNKCLCPKCRKEIGATDNNVAIIEHKQLTIFDMEVIDDYKKNKAIYN